MSGADIEYTRLATHPELGEEGESEGGAVGGMSDNTNNGSANQLPPSFIDNYAPSFLPPKVFSLRRALRFALENFNAGLLAVLFPCSGLYNGFYTIMLICLAYMNDFHQRHGKLYSEISPESLAEEVTDDEKSAVMAIMIISAIFLITTLLVFPLITAGRMVGIMIARKEISVKGFQTTENDKYWKVPFLYARHTYGSVVAIFFLLFLCYSVAAFGVNVVGAIIGVFSSLLKSILLAVLGSLVYHAFETITELSSVACMDACYSYKELTATPAYARLGVRNTIKRALQMFMVAPLRLTAFYFCSVYVSLGLDMLTLWLLTVCFRSSVVFVFMIILLKICLNLLMYPFETLVFGYIYVQVIAHVDTPLPIHSTTSAGAGSGAQQTGLSIRAEDP
eukprot:Nk52_evm11s1737 gene=Nk52_evmTU11s1737